MKFSNLVGLAVASSLALGASVPAHAGATADFSGCDGLRKPKSSDDGFRGEAKMPAYGMATAQRVINSCNAALERRDLKPHQNLRRAHLLRARAAAHLVQKNTTSALADLDAAERELGEYRGDFFFDRSMGVSLDLLRAIAFRLDGQDQEALQLAEAAQASRPYAMQVQMASTVLRDLHAPSEQSRAEIWSNLARLAPASRPTARRKIAMEGDPDEVVRFMSEEASEDRPAYPFTPNVLAMINGGDINEAFGPWLAQYDSGLDQAYARAATGHVDDARLRLTELQSAIESAIGPQEGSTDQTGGLAAIAGPLLKQFDAQYLSPEKALVEARIALAQGRPGDVVDILEGHDPREGVQAAELYAQYEKARAASPDALADLPQLAFATSPGSDLTQLPQTLLIRPEDAHKLIDYEKSRPDVLGGLLAGALSMGLSLLSGFDRTKGFQSEKLESGLIRVEFNGETTSAPIVQEMTLLRAAEIAQGSASPYFLLRSRKDYGVYWGTSWERTLTGYKTVFEIELPQDQNETGDAFETIAVIDALGPVYYEEQG